MITACVSHFARIVSHDTPLPAGHTELKWDTLPKEGTIGRWI